MAKLDDIIKSSQRPAMDDLLDGKPDADDAPDYAAAQKARLADYDAVIANLRGAKIAQPKAEPIKLPVPLSPFMDTSKPRRDVRFDGLGNAPTQPGVFAPMAPIKKPTPATMPKAFVRK